MKKIVLAMAAASVVGFSASAQANKVEVCVFDLLGKSGESYKVTEPTILPVVKSPICTTLMCGANPLITSSLADAVLAVVRM